jgi:hypothetical protein
MAEAPGGARIVTLPARGWAVVSIPFVVMIALLAVQLAAINHQREIAKRQEERTVRVLESVRDPLREARPAVDDTVALIQRLQALAPEARRLVRDGSALARASLPLVEELRDTELGRTARALTVLTERLLEDDRAAVAADLTVRTLRELQQRGTLQTLDAVRLLPELVQIQRRTLEVQERTLSVQERTLAILRQSLAVQRETLVHARSLDRKTGGPALGQGGAGAP